MLLHGWEVTATADSSLILRGRFVTGIATFCGQRALPLRRILEGYKDKSPQFLKVCGSVEVDAAFSEYLGRGIHLEARGQHSCLLNRKPCHQGLLFPVGEDSQEPRSDFSEVDAEVVH